MPLGNNRTPGRRNSPDRLPVPAFDLSKIKWRAAFTGAFLDFFVSQLAQGIIFALFTASLGNNAPQDQVAVSKAFDGSSYFWALYGVGVTVTLCASFVAGWLAEDWHTQHGFLSAVLSQIVISYGIALLVGQLNFNTFEFVSMLIVLDAGALGGWLAGVVQARMKAKTT